MQLRITRFLLHPCEKRVYTFQSGAISARMQQGRTRTCGETFSQLNYLLQLINATCNVGLHIVFRQPPPER